MGYPHPIGTLVTGKLPDGTAVRESCQDHPFEIATEAVAGKQAATSTGEVVGPEWVQSARCLLCCYTTMPITAEFWHHEADAFDLAGFFGVIAETIDHYQTVRSRLEEGWMGLANGTGTGRELMRNFD